MVKKEIYQLFSGIAIYSEEGYFAAIKFGGFANEKIILKKQEELIKELSDLKIQMIGNFFYLGY